MLTEDLDVPRKQRHTGRRVWQRLFEEDGAQVAESTVYNMVARLRIAVGARQAQLMNGPPGQRSVTRFSRHRLYIQGRS